MLGEKDLHAVDWSTLPQPEDDGAARHLEGLMLPSVTLAATSGDRVELRRIGGRAVIYIYPMTGRPGTSLPEGWDQIPGARGCTPQACGFRDHFRDLVLAGAGHVFGLSTQTNAEQREAAERLHLPFPLLSDTDLQFATALRLPSMIVEGRQMLKRMALIVDDGRISHAIYPVFPPDRNAADVLAWLQDNPPSKDNPS